MSEAYLERRRRGWRTAILLGCILCVVCAASLFAYRSGMAVLEERADAKLTREVGSCGTAVRDRIGQIVAVLELLSGQEMNRSILAKDPDDEIGKALRTALEQSDCFAEICCFDRTTEVVASTRYRDIGSKVPVSQEVLRMLTEGARAYVSRDGQDFTVTVPVHYQFDERECIGYFRVKADRGALLVDDRGSISRVTANDGEVLAERIVSTPHVVGSEVSTDHAHTWGNAALSARSAPIKMPLGLNDPLWSAAVAQCNSDLEVEASVLGQMVVLLTLGTAGLVLALVLVFSRFEGRLIARLVERTRELGLLNDKLDRSRSDLVKAARIAGMSEVATGILHSVGNTLNSLNTAAYKVDEALLAVGLADLNRVVDYLDREEDEFAKSVRGHARGVLFLSYLSDVTKALEADRSLARQELGCVRSGIDHIAVLVRSQQELVTRSSFREATEPGELMEGALVISDQVLGPPRHLRIERDFEALPNVIIEKHRVIEILVNLINNARHSLDQAGRSEPVIILRICAPTDRVLRLQVIDNGVGIPPENMIKIFHHGFSTRPGGHGFGLHAAINSSRALGGSLAAESAGPDRGATFTVELPLDRGTQSV